MLHSFICSNEEGYILMARYFSPKIGNTAKKSYEAELAQVCFQSSSVWERMKKDRMDQIISCQGQYVILRQIGELRLILSGNEEYDEVILEEILTVITSILSSQLEKKLTEASFLANYAKIVVVLDEMVQQGHLENIDENSIQQMVKLLPYPAK